MKGTITRCVAELVQKNFGAEKWEAILKDANVSVDDRATLMLATSDVDDAVVVRLLQSTTKVLGLTPTQVYDAFGEYWCCEYAPKLYKVIVARFSSAKEMILGMDKVHVEMTQTMEKARPPRFDYDWKDDKTLIVTYKSPRNLVGVYAGLVRGVGKLFKEPLTVTELGSNKVQIVFN